ncbi:hypothetical protein ACTXT7_013838 [Hymenolepis weldensis]
MKSSKICEFCEASEHLGKTCPLQLLKNWQKLEATVPELPSYIYLMELSNAFERLTESNTPDAQLMEQHQSFVNRLEEFFQTQFPGSKVEIYGSWANGFAIAGNSLDLSLALSTDIGEASLDKSREKGTGNCLNLHSKERGFSSFASSLLLIYYLQQKGYLPCLQEAYEGDTKPEIIEGNCNVWFQTDRDVVAKLWKPPTDNKTVAELWINFLKFYLFEFDRSKYHVNIDSLKPTEHTEPIKYLSIIDPFLKSHNLTAALKPKVARPIVGHRRQAFAEIQGTIHEISS